MAEGRVKWIDWCRGIGIFIVIFIHVGLGLQLSGRFVEYDYFLFVIMRICVNMIMPLFFIISGLLYFDKSKTTTELSKSILNKAIQLGIPYLLFSVFNWSIKFLLGTDVKGHLGWNDLLLIPVRPFDYLWFLYVLLLAFVISELLDYYFKNNVVVFGIFLTMAIISWHYWTEMFIVNRAMEMIIYFYIGKMLRLHIQMLKSRSFFVLIILSYLLLQFVDIRLENVYRGMVFVVAVSASFSVLSIGMRLNENNRFFKYFCKIGLITMPIFLVHAPIVTATRICLFKAGIDNFILHFIIGISVAWFLSILIAKIAGRYKYLDMLFYPGKYLVSK